MTIQAKINGLVCYSTRREPVEDAEVQLIYADAIEPVTRGFTNAAGQFELLVECEEGDYFVRCTAFGKPPVSHRITLPRDDSAGEIILNLDLGFRVTMHGYSSHDDRLLPVSHANAGRRVMFVAESGVDSHIASYLWQEPRDTPITSLDREAEMVFPHPGSYIVAVTIVEKISESGRKPARATTQAQVVVAEADVQKVGGHIRVTMDRTSSDPTLDQALWVAIRNRTHAISFDRYRDFISRFFESGETEEFRETVTRRLRDFGNEGIGVGAYQFLKYLTETFLLLECGVRIDRHRHHDAFDPGEEARRLGHSYSREEIERKLQKYLGPSRQLPYITRVLKAAYPDFEREGRWDDRLLSGRINEPLLIELIHTYYLGEGMLMRTMNAICQRFKNYRGPENRDPLVNLEIDPLRRLNNLIWGYIQDEPNRLSPTRLAFEFQHEYCLTPSDRPVSGGRPAEIRSAFLESFHHLLYQSTLFFKQDFQTTVIADGYPLLNELKEVHLALAKNDGNQIGDLPWTARVDTLLIQFMLARPEMRNFLQSRVMVPYKEAWMPQVDSMKSLQGWTDVTVTHFRDLAVYSEQLLLSIRYGDWISVNDEDSAKNWARYWRQEILGYLHAYRAAVGVDLTNPGAIDSTIPAVHLQRRLALQRGRSDSPGMLGLAAPGGQSPSRITSRIHRSN
jgi:hypothetical protein